LVRVEPSATFTAEATRHIWYLAEAEAWSRVQRLREDIADLQARLAYFPELGRELASQNDVTLRRIVVGRLPYLVWYLWDPRGRGFVQLQRLFHARQRTPHPRLLDL
jgi:plasmid stabilization system protein ParE